jgi:hypothetical protein
MAESRDSVSSHSRVREVLSPRSAAGGTSESIAKLQIDNLHSSLVATIGRTPQARKHPRKKD